MKNKFLGLLILPLLISCSNDKVITLPYFEGGNIKDLNFQEVLSLLDKDAVIVIGSEECMHCYNAIKDIFTPFSKEHNVEINKFYVETVSYEEREFFYRELDQKSVIVEYFPTLLFLKEGKALNYSSDSEEFLKLIERYCIYE